MKRLLVLTAAGAALVYFLDPRNGKRRRHLVVDRTAGFVRQTGTRLRRLGKHEDQPNDATLVQKVESEVFRDPELPKGQINLNAENGVVFLRGEVESEDLVRRLEQAVADVQGVKGVENLLHAKPA
jgi:osmotically-inducible protein OsmY